MISQVWVCFYLKQDLICFLKSTEENLNMQALFNLPELTASLSRMKFFFEYEKIAFDELDELVVKLKSVPELLGKCETLECAAIDLETSVTKFGNVLGETTPEQAQLKRYISDQLQQLQQLSKNIKELKLHMSAELIEALASLELLESSTQWMQFYVEQMQFCVQRMEKSQQQLGIPEPPRNAQRDVFK